MNPFYSNDPADDAQRWLNSEGFDIIEESRKCRFCGLTIESGCDCPIDEEYEKELQIKYRNQYKTKYENS